MMAEHFGIPGAQHESPVINTARGCSAIRHCRDDGLPQQGLWETEFSTAIWGRKERDFSAF
jgi:hypothetical protein